MFKSTSLGVKVEPFCICSIFLLLFQNEHLHAANGPFHYKSLPYECLSELINYGNIILKKEKAKNLDTRIWKLEIRNLGTKWAHSLSAQTSLWWNSRSEWSDEPQCPFQKYKSYFRLFLYL